MDNIFIKELSREQSAAKAWKIPSQVQECLPNGELPLHAAVRRGKLKEAEDILNKNPSIDLSQKDSEGMTVWDHANLSENKESLPLLLKAKFGALWAQLISLFHSVFSDLQIFGIQMLIEETEKDYSKELQNPLHEAAFAGDLDALKKLVNRENVNAQTVRGFTPLHLAALAGKNEVVSFLLKMGAQKDLLSQDRKSALHMAAIGDQQGTAELLIQNGFKIDEQDIIGATPLHFAMLKENFQTAPLLIQKGADLQITNRCDLNPLAAFAGAAQIRCKDRDQLELSEHDWFLFQTIVISRGLRLANLPFLEWVANSLNGAERAINGFQNANTLGKTCYIARVLFPFIGLLSLEGGGGYLTQAGRIFLGAGLATNIVTSAWSAYCVAKSSLQGIAKAWKHSRYEIYRPIRNALVHAVNGSDTAIREYDTASNSYRSLQWVINLGNFNSDRARTEPLEGPEKVCSEFKSKEECLASEKLDPNDLEHAKWILGLDDNADCRQAKKALGQQGLKFHPDKCSQDKNETCTKIFRSMAASKETICKAENNK